MPEDRSLDEFAAGPSGSDDDEAGDAESGGTAGDEQSGGAADADPAVPTATWAADPAACERCGERVSRRWLDDDALVCGDCKAW